ncbi:aminodeoxychorismate synthase component I [Rhodococcoides corynebacterioides]|uniref:aminodeoxychorismate synthase n=1 Tax=Rhodococcoides corynebacterioides TaxID=53972 RepID=A0ABS7P9J3_9NOCA|nr:aminodeoxychorismate synthase component I [Rhodococcus corynebacterioides]MBY6368497.1 aminodeoxychorismate synthase component I [Rhodococcus corynebacterioides]MBY6409354.1 aminodeoxychorismate synthase component I [Rhodococcus corynebacterioides]
MTRVLLVDNVDSFTYNLAELLAAVTGERPVVVRNDVPFDSLDLASYDAVVLSPGPGNPQNPADFGVCARILDETAMPVLGVCLGHQGIAAAHGACVVRAAEPMHGRLSRIEHTGTGLFAGLDHPLSVVRYHSLIVEGLPDEVSVTAWTADGVPMAIEHATLPRWGVQFHPESIESAGGHRLIANFLDLARAARPQRSTPVEAPPAPARAAGSDAVGYEVLVREVGVDADPRAVYDAVTGGDHGRFWLDGSVEPDARFTIIGDCRGPLAEYVTYDVDTTTVTVRGSDGRSRTVRTPFFDYLDASLRDRALPHGGDRQDGDPRGGDLPFDFRLGYVGYLGYELKAETGGDAVHSSPDPDAALVFADRAVVLDHDGRRAFALALTDGSDAVRSASDRWLDEVETTLRRLPCAGGGAEPTPIATHPTDTGLDLRHNHASYVDLVAHCQSEIAAGETYEVCLTNVARSPVTVDPVSTFDHLRTISPVPYGALLEFDGLAVVSTSPERFLRIDTAGVVESKPIKGTRPRGATAGADAALREDLVASEKDRAENLMIVDLVRNDLSRVCATGSVHVPVLFGIESYASVHQMVSTVRGALTDASAVDCVRAMFPGGSMTGAPKVRTMEIIDRLEAGPRGVYSGSIGYLSLNGTADLSIVIRTLVTTPEGARFGIGGAITALSDPEEEFEETLVKASTMARALAAAPVRTTVAPAAHRPALSRRRRSAVGRQHRA